MVTQALSHELRAAGFELLRITDDLKLNAQAAMWIFDYSLQEWRFYLVSSLIESEGRKRIYQLLLQVFSKVSLPGGMSMEDIHLGSIRDPLFAILSGAVVVNNGLIELSGTNVNGFIFDALVYRNLQQTGVQASKTHVKRFAKAVRELVDAD